ncbi:uncharacterized protein BP01DRAFT_94197 [Aspergillus saccharolyticus JOP 1030-1]|uniref:Uncharacterized protein n=1 Tax=Aspergillus saccharolyticus JOP 1030-1 TaxID=1450539 RepID=A0A318Z907_9EURO|nr:hypothetical protein BP01DRAFT_94197 [Aspergillus saccharolyticus JOP 1030-1]PYH43855.1 hypothetical protein BP01DRAFT_94197 [Aspergillus saccharolyticus JOP 1030-1]
MHRRLVCDHVTVQARHASCAVLETLCLLTLPHPLVYTVYYRCKCAMRELCDVNSHLVEAQQAHHHSATATVCVVQDDSNLNRAPASVHPTSFASQVACEGTDRSDSAGNSRVTSLRTS